jgi:HNH endonuclease
MAESLEQIIRNLAGNRCEYCKIPQGPPRMRHVLDHVIATQHGGQTVTSNLALCCPRCNQFKGPNIAGIDPDTGQLTRLFHPRTDIWAAHFRYRDIILLGLTDVGRTTVAVLAINQPMRLLARQALRELRLF